MSTGRRATGRRTEDDFSYRDLFDSDASFGEPGLDEPHEQSVDKPERRRTEMSERGWEDLPEHAIGDAPNRFDIDGFRARLFGGPSATLYGDSGIPAQSDWDSKEIPAVPEFDPEPEPEPVQETGSLVRPYTKTGGRTRSDYDLAIEALVSTSDRGRVPDAAVRPEHRSICGLCLDTRSVAEVAAHLRLPLGVARVLIGDMAGMGLVSIHQSGMVVGDRPSIEFMERVLSGLRRL
ncbi:multi-component regulatory system-6 [Alloactinosynnema sp. L-07]|uniref:DUF742 domain-containing protein n=1 Tax=Alloactinosynnema sp. L-07 TaxID=1653480 RepID=UPI00065EFB2C|nr:DUF742 domain-containing protein [Alloactinosynnema sp. L-07]CRK61279.1 multi-component regulatory system-6 [Alloactinosynnema sp. L-07]